MQATMSPLCPCRAIARASCLSEPQNSFSTRKARQVRRNTVCTLAWVVVGCAGVWHTVHARTHSQCLAVLCRDARGPVQMAYTDDAAALLEGVVGSPGISMQQAREYLWSRTLEDNKRPHRRSDGVHASEVQCACCGFVSAQHAMKQCAACRRVDFCSAHCLKAHWPEHKELCKKLRVPAGSVDVIANHSETRLIACDWSTTIPVGLEGFARALIGHIRRNDSVKYRALCQLLERRRSEEGFRDDRGRWLDYELGALCQGDDFDPMAQLAINEFRCALVQQTSGPLQPLRDVPGKLCFLSMTAAQVASATRDVREEWVSSVAAAVAKEGKGATFRLAGRAALFPGVMLGLKLAVVSDGDVVLRMESETDNWVFAQYEGIRQQFVDGLKAVFMRC